MLFISILSLITAKAVNIIKINHIHFTRISFIILLYSGALSLNALYIQSIGSGIGIYNGLFHINHITQLMEIIMFTVGGVILLTWPLINNTTTLSEGEIKGDKYSTNYSILVLFSILGSSLLISSFDLISIYLSIELQSFGLYVLATLYRDSESSTKAGLKYFLLGGLSSSIILLGSGIIYSYTGITNLESLYLLNSITNQEYIIQGLNLGIIIIFIGFLFKIAAAPLHNWSPDVYDEVPTIVTTWLTIIPKIAILILFLELQNNLGIISINNSIITELLGSTLIKNLLLISSLLSLIIGSLLGLAQIKIKRLLAYSTISHIGFILLALAINTEQSIDSFIFYIIQYTITNLNIFLIVLALSYKLKTINLQINNEPNKDINYISEFKGLFTSNPLLCICLAMSLFSMAGVPPLVGFFSKQFVLYSALENGYYFISIIAIILSVISASYYLQIIKNIYQLNDNNELQSLNNNSSPLDRDKTEILSNVHSYIISVLSLFILLFFLKPSILLNSTQLLALSLFFN